MRLGSPKTPDQTAKRRGFTIVELLIVIVVIGILAAITIVAYNGIQNRANDSVVQQDLSTDARQFELYRTDSGTYPKNAADLTAMKSAGKYPIKPSRSAYKDTNNLIYCNGDGTDYALIAVSKSGAAYVVSGNSPAPRAFSAYSPGQATICPAAGMSNTGQWGYTPTTGWASWVSS